MMVDVLNTNIDIENNYDFDYSVNEVHINTIEEFDEILYKPSKDKNRMVYYRGERINQLSRPLLATMYRHKEKLFKGDNYHCTIDANGILDYYKSFGKYFELYNTVFGKAGRYQLYDICSFSQHYLGSSPLIDFTKSLNVALSFGLKEKTEFNDDAILYVVEINDENEHYTNDKVVAECWLNEYKVELYDFNRIKDSKERAKAKAEVVQQSPNARLIDITTNDNMKFQQGVFLLLTDFTLIHNLYLTKNVRDSFSIRKYIISKEICPILVKRIAEETPWYRFSALTKIADGINLAIKKDKSDF